eukprot:2032599-Rhodomonas_salina.2
MGGALDEGWAFTSQRTPRGQKHATRTPDSCSHSSADQLTSMSLQILWKNKVFVFGGFYDTGHDVRYYNDAYLYDLLELKWTKLGDDKRGDNANWYHSPAHCSPHVPLLLDASSRIPHDHTREHASVHHALHTYSSSALLIFCLESPLLGNLKLTHPHPPWQLLSTYACCCFRSLIDTLHAYARVFRPSPRSACGLGEFEDTIFMYGGELLRARANTSLSHQRLIPPRDSVRVSCSLLPVLFQGPGRMKENEGGLQRQQREQASGAECKNRNTALTETECGTERCRIHEDRTQSVDVGRCAGSGAR